MELVVHLDGLCDCSKQTLQYRTLSRSPVKTVLTTAGVELVKDLTPASFTAAIQTSLRPYDRRGDVLVDDPVLSIVPW